MASQISNEHLQQSKLIGVNEIIIGLDDWLRDAKFEMTPKGDIAICKADDEVYNKLSSLFDALGIKSKVHIL